MIYWSTHEICEGNRTRRNTGTGPRDLELWAKVDHAYDRKCTQQAAARSLIGLHLVTSYST